MVFVKRNGNTGRRYGIVQFYGTIQLYIILNEYSYREPDFAVLGLLNTGQDCTRSSQYRSGNEAFTKTDLFAFQNPLGPLPSDTYEEGLTRWATDLNEQAAMVLGKDKLKIKIEKRAK